MSCSVASDFLQPHRLYSLWRSPGQNTGVGSLSLLQGISPTQGLNPHLPHCRQILYQLRHQRSPMKVEVTQSCPVLCDPRIIQSMEFSRPDTGVGSLSLLQGISPTHESNQGLLHCRRILYQLSYQGSPKSLLMKVKEETGKAGITCTKLRLWYLVQSLHGKQKGGKWKQ